MKRLSCTLILAAVAAPLCALAAPKIEIQQPWSRPAVSGTNAVGYMVLVNRGDHPDVLAKVESPIARRVEMHSASMAGGVMSMKTQDKVIVPAGGRITFAPGAYHLMFVGLSRTLKAGDQAPATLTFASGAKFKVSFPVTSGGAPAAMAGMAH